MTSRTRYEIIRHSGYLSPDLAQKRDLPEIFTPAQRQAMHAFSLD